jgi:hypothetical protein
MNHREPPHLAAGVRRALRYLSLLLLPTLASSGTQIGLRRRTAVGPSSTQEEQYYLPAIGAPELRFLTEPPPLDLQAGPPPTKLPKGSDPGAPDFTAAESTVSTENARAAGAIKDPSSEPSPESHEAPAGPHKAVPAPILPDDIRPRIKPDDFLPFFQVPGAAGRPGDVILTVPAPASPGQPAPLPPSSATYTQTPK